MQALLTCGSEGGEESEGDTLNLPVIDPRSYIATLTHGHNKRDDEIEDTSGENKLFSQGERLVGTK